MCLFLVDRQRVRAGGRDHGAAKHATVAGVGRAEARIRSLQLVARAYDALLLALVIEPAHVRSAVAALLGARHFAEVASARRRMCRRGRRPLAELAGVAGVAHASLEAPRQAVAARAL